MFKLIGKLIFTAISAWALQSVVTAAAQRARHRKTLKRNDQDQLQRWEGEGGNPAPPKAVTLS